MQQCPSRFGQKECAAELNSKKISVIVHTAPAAHPYASTFNSGEHAPFHGQRGFLTHLSVMKFNTRFNAAPSSVSIVDEFELTYPLRDFQNDALHWYVRNHPKNLFAIRTVSTFMLYRLDALLCV